MPYVKKENRNQARINPKTAGELNFAITATVVDYIERRIAGSGIVEFPLSYELLNEVVGAMQSAKDEFIRRVVAPYEDSKIKQNGDVYPDCLLTKPKEEVLNYSALRRETMKRRVNRRDIQEEVLDVTQRDSAASMGAQNAKVQVTQEGYRLTNSPFRETNTEHGHEYRTDVVYRVPTSGAFGVARLYLNGMMVKKPYSSNIRIMSVYGWTDIYIDDMLLTSFGNRIPHLKVVLTAITMAVRHPPRSMEPPRDVRAVTDALDAGTPLPEALLIGERAAIKTPTPPNDIAFR